MANKDGYLCQTFFVQNATDLRTSYPKLLQLPKCVSAAILKYFSEFCRIALRRVEHKLGFLVEQSSINLSDKELIILGRGRLWHSLVDH